MKNDGKGFLEMMEQLAERRMQREEEEEEEEGVVENATTGRLAGVSVPHLDAQRNAQTGQYGSEDEDEEDEEDDEEFDDDEEDEPVRPLMCPNNHQLMYCTDWLLGYHD